MMINEVTTKALSLKPIEKIHLVETLLDSLDHQDANIEQRWAEESEKRFKAYKEGVIEGVSLDQIRNTTRRDFLSPLQSFTPSLTF
ncbi:addiction module protein [Desulfonatronum thioautotrophicum]|uniref:addiction module protein n=1 Tax=Desulfonatronum thioautotrophicum TaxID=617001 RepID=UPI000A024F2D|nr:addiction module protein [Desulfonatronum thioautotrophicum]